jgi:hypothetical protein
MQRAGLAALQLGKLVAENREFFGKPVAAGGWPRPAQQRQLQRLDGVAPAIMFTAPS